MASGASACCDLAMPRVSLGEPGAGVPGLAELAERLARISTIVTDDGDFASASGIVVFTANSRALA